ncbi:hypothetical protein BC940DRAFT_344257 [Gongronella butleri]|nr:hypothetical protein BC940DRAFT_344257 [Gongronella butleri]
MTRFQSRHSQSLVPTAFVSSGPGRPCLQAVSSDHANYIVKYVADIIKWHLRRRDLCFYRRQHFDLAVASCCTFTDIHVERDTAQRMLDNVKLAAFSTNICVSRSVKAPVTQQLCSSTAQCQERSLRQDAMVATSHPCLKCTEIDAFIEINDHRAFRHAQRRLMELDPIHQAVGNHIDTHQVLEMARNALFGKAFTQPVHNHDILPESSLPVSSQSMAADAKYNHAKEKKMIKRSSTLDTLYAIVKRVITIHDFISRVNWLA